MNIRAEFHVDAGEQARALFLEYRRKTRVHFVLHFIFSAPGNAKLLLRQAGVATSQMFLVANNSVRRRSEN